MPTSKIEKELLKATKLDGDDYKKRQDLLEAVLEEVNGFKDPAWNKLSEDAQLWINSAIKAKKAEKRLPEFPDVGDVKPGKADDDDEDEAPKKKKKADADEDGDDDEDDKPKKKKAKDEDDDEDDDKPKKKSKSDDDDEDEAPKKKKKASDDEDDDDAPKKKRKSDDDDDDDEKPKKKKKASEDDDDEDDKPKKKKRADDDEDDDDKPAKKKKTKSDDEDEDDDKPKKKSKEPAVPQKASGIKVAIKTAIVNDPEISVDALVKKLGKGGAEVSKVTVSNVRADFRHSLKLLKELGKLKGVDL